MSLAARARSIGASTQPTRAPTEARALRVLGWMALIAALSLVLGTQPPIQSFALLAGLTFVALTLHRPLWILVAIVFAIPFSGWAPSFSLGEFALNVADLLVVLLLVAWLLAGAQARQLRIAGGVVVAAPLAVLAAALLSTPGAQSFGLALKELFKWIELIVVAAFVATYVRTEREQRIALAALLLAGAAQAAVGVRQFLLADGPPWFAIGPFMRAYGDFGQPNPFAGYLGMILPLAILLAAAPGPSRFRWLAGGSAALLVAAMLMSLSRGAWLGTTIALALVAFHWSPRSRALLAPATIGVVALVVLALLQLLPPDLIERFAAIVENFGIFDVREVVVTPENFAVVERMAHWQAGWSMFLDHPILGVGPGNYPARYDEYNLPGWLDPLGHAHNYYLNTAAELGLVGLAALLGMLAAAFAQTSVRLRSVPRPTFERAVVLGVLGGLLVLGLHNLFDSLFVHGVGIQVGLYLGLVARTPRSTLTRVREGAGGNPPGDTE